MAERTASSKGSVRSSPASRSFSGFAVGVGFGVSVAAGVGEAAGLGNGLGDATGTTEATNQKITVFGFETLILRLNLFFRSRHKRSPSMWRLQRYLICGRGG